jgi:hypothetical protein
VPLLLAVREALVGQHIDQLVGGAAQLVGPEADDVDAVLLEEVQGDLGESSIEIREPAGHGVVGAELVHHGRGLLWMEVGVSL